MCQKVQRELHLWKVELAQHAQAQQPGIEVQRHRRVLDAQHRMIENEAPRRRGRFGADTGVAFRGKGHVATVLTEVKTRGALSRYRARVSVGSRPRPA